MEVEKHTIDITLMTKTQILEKLREIFEKEETIFAVKIEPTRLEYETPKNQIPASLQNPSLRRGTWKK